MRITDSHHRFVTEPEPERAAKRDAQPKRDVQPKRHPDSAYRADSNAHTDAGRSFGGPC